MISFYNKCVLCIVLIGSNYIFSMEQVDPTQAPSRIRLPVYKVSKNHGSTKNGKLDLIISIPDNYKTIEMGTFSVFIPMHETIGSASEMIVTEVVPQYQGYNNAQHFLDSLKTILCYEYKDATVIRDTTDEPVDNVDLAQCVLAYTENNNKRIMIAYYCSGPHPQCVDYAVCSGVRYDVALTNGGTEEELIHKIISFSQNVQFDAEFNNSKKGYKTKRSSRY